MEKMEICDAGGIRIIEVEKGQDVRQLSDSEIFVIEKDENKRRGYLAMPSRRKRKMRHYVRAVCPECGRGCWKPPDADRVVMVNGLRSALCTRCAFKKAWRE